ncbi:hypothetical protein F3Y22_tig00110584pilonHSYRG00425 [Hibiscus syriacus]|uniref:Phorbol-ester/DAG-type domain-containing protein n=1 Tax=Hibiscus syriacus TaxID=106335 RepID=A0A6A3A7Y2_HIBSY|nr:hypothetical protein F3Y22_tig00110584pilonHSYRG00425 [Hibiscus syriacus]
MFRLFEGRLQFVVHVKCVLEYDSLYTIIDQENGDRDDASDSSSSIRVIKVNELGEAMKCSFSLDFACITLPLEVRHKCDRHILKLSYEDGEDDPEQFRCDVCEKKRDAYRLYYSCSTCDNSVHSRCALGGYPFLKDGTIFSKFHGQGHFHVNYIGKVVDGYSYCSICGKPCQDEVVKCTKCDYIVHVDCRYVMSSSCFLFFQSRTSLLLLLLS